MEREVFRRGCLAPRTAAGGGARASGWRWCTCVCTRRGGDVTATSDGGVVFMARLPVDAGPSRGLVARDRRPRRRRRLHGGQGALRLRGAPTASRWSARRAPARRRSRRSTRLRPDLVLLDVYLPDMTGLEVLRRLRAAGSAVDVIVISAARDVDSVRSALHGGVFHYLVKPFDGDVRGAAAATTPRTAASWPSWTRRAGPTSTASSGLARGTAARPARRPRASPRRRWSWSGRRWRRGATGLSATECSERTGLSRVSTRRYLEHLVASSRPTSGAVRRRRPAGAPLQAAGRRRPASLDAR